MPHIVLAKKLKFKKFKLNKTSLSELLESTEISRGCHIYIYILIPVRSLMLMQKTKGMQNLKIL